MAASTGEVAPTSFGRRSFTSRRGGPVMLLLPLLAVASAACAPDLFTESLRGGDDPTTTVAVETSDQVGSTTVPAVPADPVDEDCPALGDSLAQINDATYAVFGETIINGSAGVELAHFQIGTAWALDEHLLVTNAHVTDAFAEFARDGVQLERALAIQAGTGEVVDLASVVAHPGYDGDPLGSPDVGLLVTEQALPAKLTLAPTDVEIDLGDDIQIVGFPGDVTDSIEIVPGQTVPQATSLTGEVTALRTHDDDSVVTTENLDIIQHQAPTTPGTSGSSIVKCGQVIGVNNAGTVNLVAAPAADGSLTIERQAAAANNFGVHVRHISELLGMYVAGSLQPVSVPLPAAPSGGVDVSPVADGLVAEGEVDEPFRHAIDITVGDDGTIDGTATWQNGTFELSGQIFADGSLFFLDNAPEVSEFNRGFYEGVVVDDVTIEGVYYEEGDEATQASFTATLVN